MKEPAKYLIAEGAIKEFLRRETVLDFSRKKKRLFCGRSFEGDKAN